MKKIFPFILLLLLFVSCSKYSYSTNKGFDNNRWKKNDVKEYEVILTTDLSSADIEIFFSHIYEPGYNKVPLTLEITYPGGKKENIPLELRLKDEEGNNLSDCSGDICDIYTTIKDGVDLEKGTYIFRLKNNFNNAFLPNAIAAGIGITALN